jgi:uncharacterized membrane protein YraQ (UPF0718 family)
MKKKMDLSFWILLAAVLLTATYVGLKDTQNLALALQSSSRLFGSVWIELLLGFVLAGLIDVLLGRLQLMNYLKDTTPGQGILIGWFVGLLVPGGPYLLFPLAAIMLKNGAAPGLLIALISAKTLVSPVRMLTYEAPLMGWPLTLARLVPALFLPPLLGWTGQWLYRWFNRS